MVTVKSIIDEVNRLLVIKISSLQQVHINVCPKDFKRPAALIECPRVTRRDVNKSTVDVTAYLTVTYFGVVDAYFISDTEVLNTAQASIMDIFKNGYITVGDRKLKAMGSEGFTGFDETSVDVQFEFNDDRGVMAEVLPLMASVGITII